jgi:hypothetical protein
VDWGIRERIGLKKGTKRKKSTYPISYYTKLGDTCKCHGKATTATFNTGVDGEWRESEMSTRTQQQGHVKIS